MTIRRAAVLCALSAALFTGLAPQAHAAKKSPKGDDAVSAESKKDAKLREKMDKERKKKNASPAKMDALAKKQVAALQKQFAKDPSKLSRIPATDVPEDKLDALQKLADAGDPESLILLGHYYMQHDELGQDALNKAGDLYKKAADYDDGNGMAWYGLWAYVSAENPADAPKRCLAWAERAAEKESPIGLYLAAMLQDSKKQELLGKAANAGFVPAMREYGRTLQDANGRLTAAGRAWVEMAAKFGDAAACELASGQGRGSKKDLAADAAKAEPLLREAVKLAKERKWNWFGTVFDTDKFEDRGAWGGARCSLLFAAYSSLCRVQEAAGKPADAAVKELVDYLAAEAKSGDVGAMAGLVALGAKFDTWFGSMECPYDSAPYRDMLQQARQDKKPHAAVVQE